VPLSSGVDTDGALIEDGPTARVSLDIGAVSNRRRDVNEGGGSTVPEPIPHQAPGGFAAAEPLPDLIRRIVREELRPIHLLLEELRDR
jgi:hypothetical protein